MTALTKKLQDSSCGGCALNPVGNHSHDELLKRWHHLDERWFVQCVWQVRASPSDARPPGARVGWAPVWILRTVDGPKPIETAASNSATSSVPSRNVSVVMVFLGSEREGKK
jgi:hypothetical protein